MTIYKTRPGVVLTELGGEYALVAVKSLYKVCPYITQINESSAFLWRQMEQGTDMDRLMAAVSDEYELDDPNAARAEIEAFIRQLKELKYILTFDKSS